VLEGGMPRLDQPVHDLRILRPTTPAGDLHSAD
jgi:hypothetical protein